MFTVGRVPGFYTVGRSGPALFAVGVGTIVRPQVQVGYDTDGAPYYGASVTAPAWLELDTDGTLYLAAAGPDEPPVQFDTDGVPYLAT